MLNMSDEDRNALTTLSRTVAVLLKVICKVVAVTPEKNVAIVIVVEYVDA